MKVYRCIAVFIFVLGITFNSFSDCGALPPCEGFPGEDPGVNCCPVIDVPFDGGVSLLIAAGIGVGIIRKRKKSA